MGRWFSVGSKTKACLCSVLEITHSGILVLEGLFLSELRVCVCLRKENHGIFLPYIVASSCSFSELALWVLAAGALQDL